MRSAILLLCLYAASSMAADDQQIIAEQQRMLQRAYDCQAAFVAVLTLQERLAQANATIEAMKKKLEEAKAK